MVARQRVRLQSARRVGRERAVLPARLDVARGAVRFHGAHPALNFTDQDKSKRHRIRVLHAAVSHVRRRLRPLLAFQGHPFRCAPLAGVAAIEAIHRGAFSLSCEWPAKLSTARVSAGGTQQLVPCSIAI